MTMTAKMGYDGSGGEEDSDWGQVRHIEMAKIHTTRAVKHITKPRMILAFENPAKDHTTVRIAWPHRQALRKGTAALKPPGGPPWTGGH